MRRRFVVEITSKIPNKKLNCGWMTSRSTKGWRALNQIRQEIGASYVHSEVKQLCFYQAWLNMNKGGGGV